jgi:hypothetical protein
MPAKVMNLTEFSIGKVELHLDVPALRDGQLARLPQCSLDLVACHVGVKLLDRGLQLNERHGQNDEDESDHHDHLKHREAVRSIPHRPGLI